MSNDNTAFPPLPQQGGEQTYPTATKQQEQDNTEDIELMLSLMTSAAPNAHWPNDMRHRINVGLYYLDQTRAKRKSSGAAISPQVGEAIKAGEQTDDWRHWLPDGRVFEGDMRYQIVHSEAEARSELAAHGGKITRLLDYGNEPLQGVEAKPVAPAFWLIRWTDGNQLNTYQHFPTESAANEFIKSVGMPNIAAAEPYYAAPVAQALPVAAKQDALRYRWLRDARADYKRAAMFSDFPHLWTCTDEMDAAVDAAMQGAKP